jgi:alpha-N-arabinofuranosidase
MEFHVAQNGRDDADGSSPRPFGSIQRAADVARAGDAITIHAGIYRERVSPPRGGESDDRRITYRAAPGERVEIKGSEVVTGWARLQNDTWTVTVPNALFGNFNPFADEIHGDWFDPNHRKHHTGAVYLDGHWLTEAAAIDEVMRPANDAALWFATVDDKTTTIRAQFEGIDPNHHATEINVRRTVFYPEKTGVNYITVSGLILRDAATPWAPPTAQQIGAIGTHWSKGWIIENCSIGYSACSGIALGKHGDQFDNTSANSAEGYVKTIERATANGWNRQSIGHHIVRNCTVSHCEQAGIVGSLGCSFSTIVGNEIHDIHVRRLFAGAEQAGIKFHGAIDTLIAGNHVYRCSRGIWLDWMAQNARVSRNLLHDNDREQDFFAEVNHGPLLVDNNFMLSRQSVLNHSHGTAFVHNYFGGVVTAGHHDNRLTPFLKPHSTQVAGLHDDPPGDDRYCNNIFTGNTDLRVYDNAPLPSRMEGNVFLGASEPAMLEPDPVLDRQFDPQLQLSQDTDGWHLQLRTHSRWTQQRHRRLIGSDTLGKVIIPQSRFENPDGSPLTVDADCLGNRRSAGDAVPGPFEPSPSGPVRVWPPTMRH